MLAPSLLSADFSDLKSAIRLIENNNGSVVHIDVMDGIFVPQISYGQPIVSSIRPLTKLPFDVHLMIEHPENHIESFVQSGADWITFHQEAAVHCHRIVQQIHSYFRLTVLHFLNQKNLRTKVTELTLYFSLYLIITDVFIVVNISFFNSHIIEDKLLFLNNIKNNLTYYHKQSINFNPF